MSICLNTSGPSVRSDAALAGVRDTSIFAVAPAAPEFAAGVPTSLRNAELLRSVPWSDGGRAGRLLRSALAQRLGVPCFLPSSIRGTQGAGPVRRGYAAEAASAPAERTADPRATIDITTAAHLVRGPGRPKAGLLFLSFDVLFEPAFRLLEAGAGQPHAAAHHFQDIVGLAVAPAARQAGRVRALSDATAPARSQPGAHYACTQVLDASGRIRVAAAAGADLAPCAGGPRVYANRIEAAVGGEDFDLEVLSGQPGPGDRAAVSGIGWMSGMRMIGGLGAPMPYDPARPETFGALGRETGRLRDLPPEASAGVTLGFGAAFEIAPGPGRDPVEIDVMAVQRLVSFQAAPRARARLSVGLFVTSSRILVQHDPGRAAAQVAVARRRCWATGPRRACSAPQDPLSPPVAGEAWHG